MIPLRHQRTIARSAAVEGFGYWSGQDCRVEFRPAPPDSGITFVLDRPDIGPPVRFPVGPACREDRPRRTVLKVGDARVEMIEHVMAALAGLEIDNCAVWVTAEEMPGCDGSAAACVEAIDAAGVVVQSAPTRPLVVTKPVRVGDGRKSIEAQPTNAGCLSIEFHLDYGRGNAIGRQSFAAEISPEQFRYELAAARTFVLREEADAMVATGKGTRVTPQDLLIFDSAGPVDNTLRYPDECVRHKVLDVVGDLALAGRPIVGHVVASCSGHQLNAALVSALLEQEQQTVRRRSA
jgi:UDP-3-O-acyl N-acetylglucosamine deacetylase